MIFTSILSIDFVGSMYKFEMIATTFEVLKRKPEKRHIPSASSALIIGAILGLIQAAFLISGAKPILNFMGVKSVSKVLNKVAKDTKFSQMICNFFNHLQVLCLFSLFYFLGPRKGSYSWPVFTASNQDLNLNDSIFKALGAKFILKWDLYMNSWPNSLFSFPSKYT